MVQASTLQCSRIPFKLVTGWKVCHKLRCDMNCVNNAGLGHASICPDQSAYDMNNSRIKRQCVRI